MKWLCLVPVALLALAPTAAGAQTHTIDTFPIAKATAHGIDGCGVNLLHFDDFHPGANTAFVFANDHERGLVRIDGQDVMVQVTDDQTGETPAKARFASPDGQVIVEEGYSVFQVAGDELSYVMGILTVIVGDERQSLPVRGEVGC